MKKTLLLAVVTALASFGCRTPEYYQDQAVQKARAYLLKKHPQLTYEESSYIRYNKPVILHSDIIGDTDSLTASTITGDMKQIQIVWHVPGNENFYSVWGACSSTMRDYSPERIFIRKFQAADTNRSEAVKHAKAYIIGHLFGTLSVEDYNEIRFREPEIFFSKFELDKSLAAAKGEFQFTMVWNIKSKPDMKLIVIGSARKNLANFKAVSGSELADSDVKANLLEPYKTISAKETEQAAAPENTEKTPPAAAAETEKLEVPAEAVALSQNEITDLSENTEKSPAPAQTSKEDSIVDELPDAPELDTEENSTEDEL